jgi:DNA polymerase-3 subunit beta
MGSITCQPKLLAETLAAVKPAVKPRYIEALKGVRITTENGKTTVTATDMDLTIRRDLDATPVNNGLDVVVSHAELAKVAKAFAGAENVTLTKLTDTQVSCSAGHRTITLQSLRAEDFPAYPIAGGDRILSLANGAVLANAIERVAKFASKEEHRPVLTGVYLEMNAEKNGELVLVATDSYRLCVRKLTGVPAWSCGGVNLPSRALTAAAKLMRKVEEVNLSAGATHGIIEWPGTRITMRIIDGQFPNYRQLIPEAWPNEVTIPMGELRDGAALGAQFLTKNAPIRFYVNGVVKLHGGAPDGPSFEEILPSAVASVNDRAVRALPDGTPTFTEGEEFEIGFNPEFLRDIANVLEGDVAHVKLISPLWPALIHGENEDEQHLIMPIRLNV